MGGLLALMVMTFVLGTFSLQSASGAQEDPCKDAGIIVKNLTVRDLWYKADGGPCFYWDENKTFVIRPGEKIGVFSDMVCKTAYCRDNPAYKDYRSADSNHNCAVAIHPGCRISDY